MDDFISRKRALEEMTFSGGIEQDGVLYVPLRDVNNHLKSLPSEAYLQTIATERYEDLCKYFGSQADFILTDRKEFKRWLERVKWHVKKVDELARRSEDEWCTDCPAYDHEKHYCPRFRKVIRRTVQEIEEERKKGVWIEHLDCGYIECPFCGSATTCDNQEAEMDLHYCFNCGANNRAKIGEQDETGRSY